MNEAGRKTRGKWAFSLLFSVLATGIVVAGYAYYQSYKTHFRSEVERQLSAVAELKTDEVMQWRKERLSDGNLFSDNPAFSGLVRRLLHTPTDADASAQIQAWLNKIQIFGQYDRVCLLDPSGVMRLAAAGDLEPVSAEIEREALAVQRSGQVALHDFYRSEHDQRVHLAVLAPIFDETDAHHPLAVLMFRIDPTACLFPFVSRWPTPSESAETLLVRRDGKDALFLSELRFEEHPPLSLRFPLTRTDLLAVKAVLGQTGVAEGVDYRGMPVYGDLRAVPDSPWFIVTRVDITEAFAPLRERLWATVMFVGALVFGAGTGVGYLWRRERADFHRERYAAAEALHESQERLHRAVENAPFPVMIHAEDGEVVMISDAWTEISGYSRADIPTTGDWTEKAYGARRPMVQDEINALYGRMEKLKEGDYTVRTKSGDRRIWDFMSSPLGRLADGRRMVVSMAMDVTDRRKADAALQESERFLRESQSIAGIGSYVLEIAAGTWQSSAALDGIFGIDDAFVRSVDGWSSLVHPNWRQTLIEYLTVDVIANRGRFDKEYQIIRHRDGATRWVHGLGQLEFDAAGRPLRMLGTIQDITDRKQTEAVLRASEQRFSAIFRGSPIGISLTRLQDGRFLDVNDAFLSLLGYSRDEILGSNPLTLHLWCDEEARKEMIRGLQERGSVKGLETRFLTKHGARREVMVVSEVIDVANDRYILGLTQDITVRKRAENILRARLQLMNLAVGHSIEDLLQQTIEVVEGLTDSPIGFYHFVEPDQKTLSLQTWSKQTLREYCTAKGTGRHYSVDEAGVWVDCIRLRRPIIHNDYASLPDRKGLPPGHAPLVRELVVPIFRKNLIVAVLGVGNKPTAYTDEDVETLTFMADVAWEIVERSRQERDLRDKNAELERFTYTVSHDLKSPLITIKGFAGALLQDVAAGRHDRLEGDLRRVADAADKMGQLLNDLLELSRIGRIMHPPAEVNLEALVRDVLRLLAGPIAERHATMVVQPGLPVVWADRQRLAEVWQNLIENALKFSRSQPQPRIEIGVRGTDADRIFFVRDNGVGIDPRYHETVFGLFNKLDAKTEGTGIGLALVRRIVEVHGGRIWTESEGLGRGTTFCFTLPTTKSIPPTQSS